MNIQRSARGDVRGAARTGRAWMMAAVVAITTLWASAGATAQPRGTAEPKAAETAAPAQIAPYIRVLDEDGGRIVRLQTAARRFVHPEGGPVLHLVAAVHIGDRSFYRALQRSLDAKDVVLFEGVRPPGTGLFDPDADVGEEERVRATQDRLRILAAAIEHVRRRDGASPQTLGELPGMLGDRAGPFVRDLVFDGWGRAIQYRAAGKEGEPGMDLWSYGADGRVGGEGADADVHVSRMDRADDERFQAWIAATDAPDGEDKGIQQQLARALGLTFQLDEMDHSKPNWRSSDMSMDQLQRRMKESGADGAGLFGMLGGSSISARLAGLMLGMIGSSKSLGTIVKIAMLDMLSQADRILEAQAGDMGKLMEIILHDRNEVVMADLKRILRDEPGHESIAIIYGGGHMPGLEEGVRGLGFEPVEDVWLNAITVDTRESGMGVREVNAMRAQLRRSIETAMRAQPRPAPGPRGPSDQAERK